MGAEILLDIVEKELKSLLPSLEIYKMRPANNYLLVSFKEKDDFLSLVRAASGVNILLEIGWLFDSDSPKTSAIESCFLKLHLSNHCIDDRLNFLINEIRSSSARRNE